MPLQQKRGNVPVDHENIKTLLKEFYYSDDGTFDFDGATKAVQYLLVQQHEEAEELGKAAGREEGERKAYQQIKTLMDAWFIVPSDKEKGFSAVYKRVLKCLSPQAEQKRSEE